MNDTEIDSWIKYEKGYGNGNWLNQSEIWVPSIVASIKIICVSKSVVMLSYASLSYLGLLWVSNFDREAKAFKFT